MNYMRKIYTYVCVCVSLCACTLCCDQLKQLAQFLGKTLDDDVSEAQQKLECAAEKRALDGVRTE